MPRGHEPAAPHARPAEIVFLIWRDCRHPESGGSEIYVETVARALAAGGNRVTIRSAHFEGAPADEWVHGVRIVRGGSKLTVYGQALRDLRAGVLGRPDVVVDVQNGMSFASPLVRVAPTVVLVHHVHREQWPVVYGPVRARIGWLLESRVAPWLYRSCRYVAVSEATRTELGLLGIAPQRVAVVHNGVHALPGPAVTPSPVPRILVLGRLVPHKQVEHVLHAAAVLRPAVPDLEVSVVGDGWWRDEVVAAASRLGVGDVVRFHGFVDEATKQQELAMAWVLALPSLKEGWGLAITEAASHGVPAVAYRSAGGVTESIVDGVSGVLVDGGPDQFAEALSQVLTDPARRVRLAAGARERAASLSWESTAEGFASVLSGVVGRDVAVGHVADVATLHHGTPARGAAPTP